MKTVSTAAASGKNEANTATPQGDRLLTFREVHELIGSDCKTAHTARALAARGQIRGVFINSRVIRYSEQSVLALVAGRVDPVACGQVIATAALEDASDRAALEASTANTLEAELAAIEARTDLTNEGKYLLKREARELAAANPKGAPRV